MRQHLVKEVKVDILSVTFQQDLCRWLERQHKLHGTNMLEVKFSTHVIGNDQSCYSAMITYIEEKVEELEQGMEEHNDADFSTNEVID